MKKLLSLGLILILITTLFAGCKKDHGNPPVLPPAESMTIDFSNFSTLKKGSDFVSDQKGTENSNWEFAAIVATAWKLVVSAPLIIPVASFKVAVDQNPVFLSEKTWQWSYNVTVASVTYKARLTGQIGATNVIWKMYITEGTKAEFLWFEGTTNSDGNSGQWILNESSSSPVPLITIDWTKTGSSIGTVKYTYVKSGTFKDSYIEYGLTSATLNAYYTVHYYNGLKFSDVNIEWNTTTHNGRVKCLDYLGDSTWHCWDSNRVNVTCP